LTTATVSPEKQSSNTAGLLDGLMLILAFVFIVAEVDAGIWSVLRF
jgi:hypothetical protein